MIEILSNLSRESIAVRSHRQRSKILSEIEFGTTLRSPYGVGEQAKKIEALGFDVVGVGEHVMFHGDSANGFISLSVAAGATERIRLLSAITLVPLYPAALLSKLGAALQVAADDRFMLGVGVGGEFPKEFEACGVPVKERGARTNEALEILRRVWTEDAVSFDGEFTQLNEFSVKPRPLNPPPIWVSGRKKVAMRRTAKYGDGWLPYMYTPEQLEESLSQIYQYADQYGREKSDIVPGVYIFTTLHEDRDRAIEMCANRLGRQYQQDFTRLVAKYALAGNADDVKTRLEQYLNAGAKFVVLSPACPEDYLDENVERIADLMTAFR